MQTLKLTSKDTVGISSMKISLCSLSMRSDLRRSHRVPLAATRKASGHSQSWSRQVALGTLAEQSTCSEHASEIRPENGK